MKKPRSLVVISWIWIVYGASGILSAIMSISALLAFPSPFANDEDAVPISEEAAAMARPILRWVFLVAIVQIAIGAAALVYAIGLLRRREWGRRGVEVMTDVSLAFLLALFVAFISAAFRAESAVFTFGGFFGFGLMGWGALTMRRHLRSHAVREAVGRLPRTMT